MKDNSLDTRQPLPWGLALLIMVGAGVFLWIAVITGVIYIWRLFL